MGAVVAIAIYIMVGVLISRLAGLIGLKIFRFTDIYNFFLKLFKKSKAK